MPVRPFPNHATASRYSLLTLCVVSRRAGFSIDTIFGTDTGHFASNLTTYTLGALAGPRGSPAAAATLLARFGTRLASPTRPTVAPPPLATPPPPLALPGAHGALRAWCPARDTLRPALCCSDGRPTSRSQAGEAMANVPVREIAVGSHILTIVTFVDRRSPNNERGEFMFQSQLEQLFYHGSLIGTTGAFFRLLGRAGAGSQTLTLRRTSVDAGLLSNAEFGLLRELLHSGVRVFSLVPITAVHAAIATFGPTAETGALLSALELERPTEWAEASSDEQRGGGDAGNSDAGGESEEEGEEEEGEEEGGEEEEGEEGEESEDVREEDCDHGEMGGGDDSDGDNSNGSSGGGSNSSSSGGGGDSRSDKRSVRGSGDSRGRSSKGSDGGDAGDVHSDVSHRHFATIPISPRLESQLQAFDRFRKSTVERKRHGKAVGDVTAADDRRSILHFLAWLHHCKQVAAPTLGSVFSSPKLGAVVQEFVQEKSLTCKYARIVKVIGSLVAAARFTRSVVQTSSVPGADCTINVVDQLVAIHSQCCAEARQETKFSIAQRPKAWLTWEECQRARMRAEAALARDESGDTCVHLELVRECALLKLLTALPPDRVGIYRQLKLGSTLKSDGGSYKLDLTERNAHKTSGVFGPTRTTVTTAVAARLDALVELDKLQCGEFLFHASDRQAALSPSAWTRFVQAVFKKYSGIALSPKDCRSSFVSWLRSGEHGDAALKAAAEAMHHSSAVAASAHYDKFGSDRVVAAAVKAADDFAFRFVA